MGKLLVILLAFAYTFMYANETDFTERFEKSSVFGKWIDIDHGKIIEINSKTTFSFERLDNDLIILKNGSNKSYLKRVGASKTSIKGRILQDNGSKTFSAASQVTVNLTNIHDSSIQIKVLTNKEGYFSDKSLPSGDYTLSVQQAKYALKVPVTLTKKDEALGTFVLSGNKTAVFKSNLSTEGTFIISNRRTHKVFVEIFNYGHKKGRVCYSVSLNDSKLRDLRFVKSCKVIPVGKSAKLPLYISFNPITINSTEQNLKVTMTDDKGRSLIENHPFTVYKNLFNLKIKTANKGMKGYVILPGQELKTIDIDKGILALPKLSDEEYKLVLANTDPAQKTAYEVDIGTEQKLIRGSKKRKKRSVRRGKKNHTFSLKQSIARYPSVGDIAVYSFTIPDSIVMQEHDKALRIRFGKENRLGDSIGYKASIDDPSLAEVSYKDGYLTIKPRRDSNGITTVTLEDPKGYGKSQKKLFTLYIKAVNDKPRITSKPQKNALENTMYSYYFKGVDSESSHLISKALDLPKWLKYNQKKALLQGVPKLSDVGMHKVVLSLSDGTNTVMQSFSIEVRALKKTPQSQNTLFTLNEDTILTNQLQTKGRKSESVTFSLLKQPENGVLKLDKKGQFTYKPQKDYYGNDTFTVRISSAGKSVDSVLSLTVEGINDAPEAKNMMVTRVGAGPLDIDWLVQAEAKDVDGDTLSIKVQRTPRLGTLTVNGENHIIYIPHADTKGEEVVYLSVEDSNGGKKAITLTLSGISKQLTPRVLQTGQKVIYHPFDDAVYRKSIRRFYEIDLNKQVVKDKVLKKTWYIGDKPDKMTFDQAHNYCQDLTVGIVENWRLPTIEELVMLTDKGRTDPAVHPIFTTISSDYYWSSTPLAQRKSYRWTVYMDYGNDYYQHEKTKQRILCVRDGIDFLHKRDLTPAMIVAAQKAAEALEDGAVIEDTNVTVTPEERDIVTLKSREVVWDKDLELVWDDREHNEPATWVGAIKICEDLSFDGRSDWRLPNFNELYSITDHNGTVPAVNSHFTQTKAKAYWTSTSGDNDDDRAWGISFADGSDFSYDKTEQIHVRCVRDQ